MKDPPRRIPASLLPHPASLISPADISLSAHYACTHCDLSFEPPSPQLFSFNSPQGMCPECGGLGEIYTFDPERLIPDPSRSFQQGCVELVGHVAGDGPLAAAHLSAAWPKRWSASTACQPGTVLETAWEELDPKLQHALLWGTGDEHITFTWRSGPSGYKWGGKFEGIIPKLLSQVSHHARAACSGGSWKSTCASSAAADCDGPAAQSAGPRGARSPAATPKFARSARAHRCPRSARWPSPTPSEFFGELELDATGADDRRRSAQGNPRPAAIPQERGPRISHARPHRADALRRRDAAHPPGRADRLRPGRRALHPRRAVDRPAPPRQRPAAGNARPAPRPGQHGGRRRARRRHDAGGRSHRRFRPRPGRSRRARRRRRTGRRGHRRAEERHRAVSFRPAADRSSRPTPAASATPSSSSAAPRTTISRTSTSRFRWACSSASPASPAPARARWSTTSWSRPCAATSTRGIGNPGEHERIEGLEHLDKMIAIDQSPIGRTPRSNPATYIKVFDEIRHLYTQLPESKARGYKPGRFSFNVGGGRCEACEGNGSTKLEMDFLADVWVTCPVCEGHRFNRETLQVRYKGKSIAEVLEMDVQEALAHFENIPADPPQAANAARRGAGLHEARPAVAHALRRRGPADQAGPRTGQEEHRPHALSARRADHRPALRRHPAAA